MEDGLAGQGEMEGMADWLVINCMVWKDDGDWLVKVAWKRGIGWSGRDEGRVVG